MFGAVIHAHRQIGQCVNKGGVLVHGRGTCHRDAECLANICGFGVEVIQNLNVVGNKSNRRNHCGGETTFFLFAKIITDIRFEPWVTWSPTSTLIDKVPIVGAQFCCNATRLFFEINFVATVVCHRLRNTVGRKDNSSLVAYATRKFRLRRQNVFNVGLDKAGMRMPPADVMNFDVTMPRRLD